MKGADFYLANMPIAFCAIKVLTDKEGNPVDYLFVYSNKAHTRLEGLNEGKLAGKRYLELHEKIGKKFLQCCYEAAFHGKDHVISDYNAERERHYLIYIYPLEKGSCACMFQDMTASQRLLQEYERGDSRETEKKGSYSKSGALLQYLRKVDQLIREQEELRKEAMRDPLVDLYNVKSGKELVTEALERMGEDEFSIMFLIDIDNFKRINDTRGHQAGDEYLKRFASILKHVFRKSDIVYRMGGDEFIGFAESVSMPELAVERIMTRLYQQLEQAEKEGFGMQCSAGIFIGSRRNSYSDFYAMADRALYAAKRTGKNKYHVISERSAD